MLVCEKVKQKGTTTYNEVADELVAEYSDSHPNMSEQVRLLLFNDFDFLSMHIFALDF